MFMKFSSQVWPSTDQRSLWLVINDLRNEIKPPSVKIMQLILGLLKELHTFAWRSLGLRQNSLLRY